MHHSSAILDKLLITDGSLDIFIDHNIYENVMINIINYKIIKDDPRITLYL